MAGVVHQKASSVAPGIGSAPAGAGMCVARVAMERKVKEASLRPTMMDVAARAGVSQATVSLILNGSPGARFNETTRQRVHEAAEALGYRLLRRERAPTGGTAAETRVIAFLADEISTDPWTALAFDGARDKALEFGIALRLAVTRGERAHEEEVCEQFLEAPVLGFIYGTVLTRRVEPAKAMFDHPAVLLNCYDKGRKLSSVLPGDLAGGRTATLRLIQAGRRRIALINGEDGLDASRDRLRGYQQALASNDINFDPALIFPGNWEPSAGYDGTHALMALADPPDAFFCANDMMAMGCFEALKELGLAIPRDVSVIGFDDREIAQFMHPGLTTLVLPQYEMGRLAAELLIEQTGGLRARHNQLKVECPLVERASV